jgi:hypothetical protein
VAQEAYLTDHTGTVICEYKLLDAQGATHAAVSVGGEGRTDHVLADYLKPQPRSTRVHL